MIRHHPSETTLAAYAEGTLPAALAVVAGTHIAACAACRRFVNHLEGKAGANLDAMVPMPLDEGALDRVLSRLDQPAPPPPPLLNADLPSPLDRVAFGRWWTLGFGRRWRPLHIAGSAWGGLLHLQPGRGLPSHGHAGRELTCVLAGSFIDQAGRYEAGDVAEPTSDHDERLVVVGHEPCLCIIASEGVRLHGWLGLAQRLLGEDPASASDSGSLKGR